MGPSRNILRKGGETEAIVSRRGKGYDGVSHGLCPHVNYAITRMDRI